MTRIAKLNNSRNSECLSFCGSGWVGSCALVFMSLHMFLWEGVMWGGGGGGAGQQVVIIRGKQLC